MYSLLCIAFPGLGIESTSSRMEGGYCTTREHAELIEVGFVFKRKQKGSHTQEDLALALTSFGQYNANGASLETFTQSIQCF